jgi:flagellar hook-length control protein FliK
VGQATVGQAAGTVRTPGQAAATAPTRGGEAGPAPAPGPARVTPVPAPEAAERAEPPAPVPVSGQMPATPAAPAAPAVPSAPAYAPPPGTPAGTAHQIAPAVFALHQRGTEGTHRITVEVAPESLGPVRLEVTLREGEVQVVLTGSSDAGRDALRAALPDLRRAVEEAGITAGSLEVSAERFTGQDRPGPERFAGAFQHHQQQHAGGRTGPEPDPAAPAEPTVPAARGRTAPGALDLHL